MSLYDPAGFDPIDARWWPMIAAALPLPWPEEAVKMDLRWWSARERMGDGTRPGRPTLVKRYGWGDRRLRDLMASPEKWEDAKNPAPRTSGVQPRSSEGPAEVQPTSNAVTVETATSPEKVQPRSSEGPAEVQPTSTGALVHRAPSTDTDHREENTDTAPVPVAVSRPKPKRKSKASAHQPTEEERESWEELLGAYAEIDTDGALRMDGGESEKLRAMALDLLRLNPRRAVLRLRYLARARGDSADYRREKGITGSPILRPSSTWCADIDEHAARWAKRCPETARAETDSRWRDPGWVPTRVVTPGAPPASGKPTHQAPAERASDSLTILRQLREAANESRVARDDRADLRGVEGRGPASPGGVVLAGR